MKQKIKWNSGNSFQKAGQHQTKSTKLFYLLENVDCKSLWRGRGDVPLNTGQWQTVLPEVADGAARRDRWYTVTKKWSSRVQQEHRNKSQDCVTTRLDYSSDNRLDDLESELRNRAWCCATFWRLPRGNSLCLGPRWRRHCCKRSNNEVSEHYCNKLMKLAKSTLTCTANRLSVGHCSLL